MFWLILFLGAVLVIIGSEILLEIVRCCRDWRKSRDRGKEADHEKPE